MNKQILMTTAIGLLMGTAALAQSPSGTTTSPPPAQSPANSASPSSSSPPPSSQPAQSGSSGVNQPSSAATSQTPPSSGSAAQTQTTSPPSSPSQAQTTPPATTQQGASSGTAQGGNSAAPANQAQQTPAQPTQPNTAQSSSSNVNVGINISDQQRTRVTQSIAQLNVRPLTNVNFSVSVGTVVPRNLELRTLPPDIVEIVPQYRGYSFFVVRDEVVIVEPSSYKIVTVLPRSGGSTATAPARTQSKVSFTDRDREAVRKHTRTTTTERRTTGSAAARVELRRGERVPDTVEIESFPEVVYRDAPALREYRYIRRENRTYVVDPSERTVIEEID